MNLVAQVLDHEARKCECNIEKLNEKIKANQKQLTSDMEELESLGLLHEELRQVKTKINE